MQDYILLGPLLIYLSALLGAAFLIERFLVLLSDAISRLFVYQYSNKNTQIEKLQEKLKRDKAAKDEEKTILNQSELDEDPREVIHNSEADSQYLESRFDLLNIIPISSILNDKKRYEKYKEQNTIRKEFWLQVLGTLIAITACYYSGFSIWIFITYIIENSRGEVVIPLQDILIRSWEYAFTGIIIGSGSKPINFLMNFLLNRRIESVQNEVKTEAKIIPEGENRKDSISEKIGLPPVTTSVQLPNIEEIVGFEYNGGDRPQRLEHVHLYPSKTKPVDLIIYHHTAMHSDAPFEEVVKEFDRKGWLTGYHCIIFQDGKIQVLCRWDRFGNHAKPYNTHSFGIALQGNFEPNPNVLFSNPDGRFGIMSPTQKQIQSAARVTALYALMHNINANFPSSVPNGKPPKDILAHKTIAKKACPGSNFPYKNYQASVKHYYTKWENDSAFRKALDSFKNQAMVMP